MFEGDTLYTEIGLEDLEPLPSGGGLGHVRARLHAAGGEAHGDSDERREVLDWRFAALLA